MNQFRRSRLWVALLVCYASGTGCENKAVQVAKPSKPKSTTEPLVKTRIVPPGDSQPVDPTKAVLVADAPDLPTGATLLDPDMVWDMWNPNSFAISPDGQSIAYISRGALWLCSVKAGPPKKLADLPNTVTELRSTMKNYRKWRGDFNKLASEMNSSQFDPRRKNGLTLVRSVKWSPLQEGVFYTLGNSLQTRPWTATYQVMHASNKGLLTTIATISRDAYDKPHRLISFDVTHDRSRVVVSNGYTPLIWDATTGKPQATSFDYLLPSTSSGRFIGIEIDTRQLVIADENLKIVKRLDVTFNPRELSNMFWSPDERFAICANRLEYAHQNKNRWVGFRIKLETGEQRPLKDGRFSTRYSIEEYVTDQFVFTGKEGEVVRASCTNKGFFDGGNNCLTTVPEGEGPIVDHCQFNRPAWPCDSPRLTDTGRGIFHAATTGACLASNWSGVM